MSAHENGGPAFPVPLLQGETYIGHGPEDGMTLRDYFAATAMQGMYASETPEWSLSQGKEHMRAAAAYAMADAMLKERAK